MSNLLIFSAEPDPLLLESAARFNLEIRSYTSRPWIGWTTGKLRKGIQFLEAQPEEFALWLDGHDSLILKPESDIIRYVPEEGVLVAAEKNCWPNPELAPRYPISHHTPRFLNSGGYCGRRVTLLGVMRTVLSRAVDENDQLAWSLAYLDTYDLAYRGPRIMLDRGRKLFCSEGDGDTVGADPCIRHWNGRVPGREEFWRKFVKN